MLDEAVAESAPTCSSSAQPGRELEGEKRWLAEHTNSEGATGTLTEVLEGANVFIGVSAPDLLSGDELAAMADEPIAFALAKPGSRDRPDRSRQACRRGGDRPQ